jgi:CheY-like chemotaxis protein
MINVLVIDENEPVCRTVKRSLERNRDYCVWVANGWQDGLTLASHTHPALILLDIDMSMIADVDFLMQLHNKAETRHIPVVAMSTSDERDTRQRASHAYVEQCLSKPFNVHSLHRVVRQILSFPDNRVKLSI